MGIRKKIGKKNLFSFLYIAGEINKTIWIIKKGNEIINDAKRDILRFDINTSGRPVNIILLFSDSLSNSNRGLDKISPM